MWHVCRLSLDLLSTGENGGSASSMKTPRQSKDCPEIQHAMIISFIVAKSVCMLLERHGREYHSRWSSGIDGFTFLQNKESCKHCFRRNRTPLRDLKLKCVYQNTP